MNILKNTIILLFKFLTPSNKTNTYTPLFKKELLTNKI